MIELSAENAFRQKIFDHLTNIVDGSGSVRREQLWNFELNGEIYHLIDRSRGIRNPRDLNATISIIMDPESGYDNEELDGSLLSYAYREGSNGGDNTKLRRAYELSLPIILLRKINPGLYVPIFPVFVIEDDPQKRRFLIALDKSIQSISDPLNPSQIEKQYIERIAKARLHQPVFRGRVMHAYEYQCAVCNLKRPKLLDAAHIIPDGHPNGDPVIENGLSLCKIHHAAYDEDYLGISPDYQVSINQELLDEVDGPMLQHGLKEMHGRKITLPSRHVDQPSRDRLDERFAQFLNV